MNQPKPIRPLRVEPLQGERGRYHVESASHPEKPHLVDLWLFGGNGQCDCEHYRFRLQHFLEEGATPSKRLRCRHIEAARERWFTHEGLDQLKLVELLEKRLAEVTGQKFYNE